MNETSESAEERQEKLNVCWQKKIHTHIHTGVEAVWAALKWKQKSIQHRNISESNIQLLRRGGGGRGGGRFYQTAEINDKKGSNRMKMNKQSCKSSRWNLDFVVMWRWQGCRELESNWTGNQAVTGTTDNKASFTLAFLLRFYKTMHVTRYLCPLPWLLELSLFYGKSISKVMTSDKLIYP